ncbi:TIGR01244 family sulfur transferase [uncultured Tateyamaria sp.]|uniref:TIGR01244 family sulfur transferase n=1 Tax=uncultured Tateyamaria sp. TaxID=455651 RepID=UPI002638465D|nr:TIGR01244 family sulfur transferase [uncultured Tateyamaria sp.]
MDIRQITPQYFVAPQVDPADMVDIAAAGITTVICNRPDEEVPPAFQADAVEAAVLAAGMQFVRLPLTHQTMTPENVLLQANTASDADGPVLAYCASGTRSTVVWCLGQAGQMPTAEILATAQRGGYDLGALTPTLEALAQNAASSE